MTTAGLGDVVVTTRAAKVFLSLYAPFAMASFGRLLALLALQPLQRARRYAQHLVAERYGTSLTARNLVELARGKLVKQLGLNKGDSFCTQNEFILLTLVLQGKVTE